MKKINCPLTNYTKTYIEDGVVKTKDYEAKTWDLSNYVDTGSNEGIRQRVREELMILQGEVLTDNYYGIYWEWFLGNASIYNSEIEGFKEQYESQLRAQIVKALNNIYNFVNLQDMTIEVDKNNKKIKIKLTIEYFTDEEEKEILEESINFD